MLKRPFYTVDESTQIIPFKKSTIFEMIRKGELRSVKVGGKRLIPREALLNIGNDKAA
ncbi:MAG: excisionase family DNA-binding protein [Sphingorhabdus sp.]|uniref:excisionase family DNA-binding protein n=1 Tax=Sphingorhabdus sp. TaxID=1902408 RepID=UPI0038FCAF6E